MSRPIVDLNPYETADDPMHQVGFLARDRFGDIWRYAKAGGSNISAGKLQLGPSPNTNHHNMVVGDAAAIGDDNISVDLGATALDVNEYAAGVIITNDEAGEGTRYRVKGHAAADSSDTSVQIDIFGQVEEALTADTSQVSLFHSAWQGVQESTTQTLQMAGVPVVDITAGDYGWVLTRGVTGVLVDETLTLGAYVTIGSSTAGAVEEADDVTAPITEPFVGIAVAAGVEDEYNPVHLMID